ncbi:MAG: AlpA family phage regulatory protein [Maritimibacter sp.]|nr:AlpA family phage regulatory protein [Maritimibacter sp.]
MTHINDPEEPGQSVREFEEWKRGKAAEATAQPVRPSIFITDQQFADRWGVSRPTIWKMAKADPDFPQPIKLSPGTTRWRLEDVENYEAARAAASA